MAALPPHGKLLCSRCDYILGSDHWLFETVGIRDPRNFLSNHFALRAQLLWQPANCDGEYLRGRRAFPLKLPPTGPLNLVDTKFQELKAIKVPPSPCAHVPRPQWMSEESLRLID